MAVPRFDRVAGIAARVVAVAAGLLAASQLWLAVTTTSRMGPLAVAALSVALAIGLWRLHRVAIKAATALFVLLAILLPLGLLSPFRAADTRPGDVGRAVVIALGASALCLALAFVIARARRDKV